MERNGQRFPRTPAFPSAPPPRGMFVTVDEPQGHVTIVRVQSTSGSLLMVHVLWAWINGQRPVSTAMGSHSSFMTLDSSGLPGHPSPSPLATTDLLTVPTAGPFPQCHRIGIAQCVAVQTGFFHSVMCVQGPSMSLPVPPWLMAHFLFVLNDTPWSGCTRVCLSIAC